MFKGTVPLVRAGFYKVPLGWLSNLFSLLAIWENLNLDSRDFILETGSEGIRNLSNSSSGDCTGSNMLMPGSSHCREGVVTFHWCGGAALRLTVIIYSLYCAKLSLHESWSSSGSSLAAADKQEKLGYMAASNLMSLHMLSQQSKGMPAPLIPLYWPYISAGCQCRGLHPESLKRQKQLDKKTDRQACICLLSVFNLSFLQDSENSSCMKWLNTA